MRAGILGGAFNPPHIGHLVLAQEAIVRLGIEAVTLVPVGRPPHRELEQDPGAEVRLELCERASAGDERLRVSRAEIDREGPSYTVDTLRELREQAPDDELFLILGGDQAAGLGSWREPEEVLTLATVVAAERGAWRREEIVVKLAGVKGAERLGVKGAERLVLLDMPRIGVSSTLVRKRVAAGQPIRYLVPDGVAELIAERGLYAAPAPVGED